MVQPVSKPLSFPVYRRSHFRSQTYLSLVRFFSHFPATPDNGSGRMEQEKPENGPQFSEFVASASVDPKDPVAEKITQEVHDITEGVGDKGRESGTNDVVLRDIDHMLRMVEVKDPLTRQLENKSKQENDFNGHQCIMDDLQHAVKGAEDLLCDGGLISFKSGLGEKQDGNSKAEGNSFASKEKIDIRRKKKRSPGSGEWKAKPKVNKRKNHAEKDRQLSVKRLKLPPVQKSKTIAYCRHYLVGRCHEGDKCKFSHDTVPLTKSMPCRHFARHSCMKGDDCPYDHELSKYPCNNFVARGFCSRGDACLFSHQIVTKEDSATPSKASRLELKSPLLLGNTSFSAPPLGSATQENRSINSGGICAHIDLEDKVIDSAYKQVTPPPKGISFINFAKSSLPSSTSSKQGKIIANEESLVQIGTYAEKNASRTDQTLEEIPKKLPSAAPKGVNFLYFGRASAPKLHLGKASTDDATTYLQGSSYSQVDHGHTKSIQEVQMASDNSHTSTTTSSMLLLSQFGLHRSSENLPFGNHEHALYSKKHGYSKNLTASMLNTFATSTL